MDEIDWQAFNWFLYYKCILNQIFIICSMHWSCLVVCGRIITGNRRIWSAGLSLGYGQCSPET